MALSVHELNRYMESKRRDKFATFEKINDQCHKQIMKYAGNDKYRCFFTVPEFILGLPLYNLNTAVLYVMEKLTLKGFLIKYYHPNILYICWDIDEIHGRKKVNPARNMLPPPPQAPPRLTMLNKNTFFPPMPEQTRVINKPDQGKFDNNIIMPHTPKYDIPFPQSSKSMGHEQKKTNSNFIKSISNYKPSGKFVLDM